MRENIPPLVDTAPLSQENIAAIVQDVEGVESYHRIRSRGAADNVAIDLHVRVDPDLSMQDANAIADEVRRRLLSLPGVGDVTVHAEAHRHEGTAPDLHAAAKLAAQEVGIALHECWVQEIDGHISMHLHVGVDPAPHPSGGARAGRSPGADDPGAAAHCGVGLFAHRAGLAGDPAQARVSSVLQQRVERRVVEAVDAFDELRNPHDIHVRQVEGRLFITLEADVDGELSVTDAHELSTQLQEAIRASAPNVGEVLVHLEPGEAAEEPVSI